MKLQKIKTRLDRALGVLGKWKLPLLFLALGVVLLLIPTGKKQETPAQEQEEAEQDFDLDAMQRRLESILSQIDGAGRVSVMLTLASGEEAVYQQDEKRSASESGSSSEQQTVLRSDSGSEKSPVVVLRKYPQFRGALIVCDGAERAGVRLSVIEAVSGLTGLGSDKISVIKMKAQ